MKVFLIALAVGKGQAWKWADHRRMDQVTYEKSRHGCWMAVDNCIRTAPEPQRIVSGFCPTSISTV